MENKEKNVSVEGATISSVRVVPAQQAGIKDRFVSWLLRALLEQFRATIQQLDQNLKEYVMREQMAFLALTRQVSRPRVYVTLRCRWTNPGETGLVAAWTTAIDVLEGVEATIPFHPQNVCTIERVDVVGPAVIVAVAVGRQHLTQPRSEYPASLDIDARCDVGMVVSVMVRGLP